MKIQTLILGELDTNCYLVSDSQGNAIVIDPADDAETILSCARGAGLQIGYIVLTHAHFDHMLAAEAIADALGITIYVGAGDADAMSDPIRNLSGLFSLCDPIQISHFDVLEEGDTVSLGDLSFKVMATPGHTPGCICLLSGEVLFSGDTLFERSIGRLDFPGGDARAMYSSLQRLMSLLPNTQVYPGHGAATTIGTEISYNPYLQ